MATSAKQLAKILNISAATVSMVLNNKPGISESTIAMVLEAAEKYGYDMSKKKIQEVSFKVIYLVIYKKHGQIVNDSPFFSQVIEGINNQCTKYQCRLQISYVYGNTIPYGSSLPYESKLPYESELANPHSDFTIQSDCSGVLLLGTEMLCEDFEKFSGLNVPIVLLDSYFEDIHCDSILINNVQGSYLATKHLISKGHTKIGYLHSDTYISNFSERANGYFNALRKANIPTEHPYVVSISPTTEQAYQDFCKYLDNNPELPTAFFADNDIIAASALRALKDHNYRVPEDISIIGFDDMPICQYIDPQLTTMCVPKQKLGALAVDRLIEKINNKSDDVVKIALGVTLIERGSVAKL